ncbi:hypothetical protein MM440_09400 [Arsenicicoccus piscis]|uniref:hypothetical protein n=1 Tax=Arsenicicoccus piscis TaxID=673954 RepID=UPI001F4D1200|nr:hypothetical protein [Arsenicicoccus piscis]MCH8627993.1 hypothetical protein [Arsenicicoccus piscis]
MSHFPPILYWINVICATVTAPVALFLFARSVPDPTLRWLWFFVGVGAIVTAVLNVFLANRAGRRR